MRTAPPQQDFDAPSLSDPFVSRASRRLGGPAGRHLAYASTWWNPVRVALLVGTVVYVLGMLYRLRCQTTVAGKVHDYFKWVCYSDIGILYSGRGLMAGNTPYLDSGDYPVLEYPVLTGWFLELERRIAHLLGAMQGSGLTAQQQVDSSLRFFEVNCVLLGGLFVIAVWAQARTVQPRPWDGMMLAASPCVAAASLINWDLLPVALTALGMLAWARRRNALAGALFGLGMAAKLYPALLLGPLFLLCLRGRQMPEFLTALSTFVLSWGLVNLPALYLAPAAWRSFWQFNSDRGGDYGSIWYVFVLAKHPIDHLNLVSSGLFALACLAIAQLIMLAPRRPRFGSMAFLVIAAFLLTNKVYSPQYVLWLLPFVVLARPRWRDWLIFTAGELFYYVAIWWHLGGELSPGDGSADKLYWLSVIVRLATEARIVVLVVRDTLRPERDPVRAPGGVLRYDDPTGGVLDGAADAPWLPALRGRPRARLAAPG